MANAYGMTYLMTEFIFLCIIIQILSRTNKNIGTIAEMKWFRSIQVIYIIGVISQMLWGMRLSYILIIPRVVVWGINIVYAIVTGLEIYLWFRFCIEKIQNIYRTELLGRVVKLQCLIAVLYIIMNIGTIWTKWFFYIDGNDNYIRGKFFLINIVLTYSHWIWSVIIIITVQKHVGKVRREQLMRMLMVSCILAFGGIWQCIDYRVPFEDAFVMLAIISMFNMLQENQIKTDALTGLNNRTQFRERYEKMLARASTEPFGIVLADIDDFKQINDTYGHLQGDQALLTVAEALRKIGNHYHTLGIYRYGGDEFVMLVSEKEVNDLEAFGNEINQVLAETVKKAGLGFKVEFSIGYEMVENSKIDGSEALNKADEKLYQNKRQRKGC